MAIGLGYIREQHSWRHYDIIHQEEGGLGWIDLIVLAGPRSICRLLNRTSHLSSAGTMQSRRMERRKKERKEWESEEKRKSGGRKKDF